MNPKQVNYLLITVTFCLAFLMWGSVIVWRTVTDHNYHAPSAEQQKLAEFEHCTNAAYGNASQQCKDLVNAK